MGDEAAYALYHIGYTGVLARLYGWDYTPRLMVGYAT